MRRTVTLVVLAALSLIVGGAHAFEWEPLDFEERPQAYSVEVRNAEGVLQLTMDIDIVASGEGFDVTTVQTVHQSGVDGSDLDTAALGGGAGLFGFGGVLLFGPSFMILPVLLVDQDIAVRAEPIELAGYGTVYMESASEVAGVTCVDIRIESAAGMPPIEFGVAEGVPFPCYSRYGEGEDAVEIRLTRIE